MANRLQFKKNNKIGQMGTGGLWTGRGGKGLLPLSCSFKSPFKRFLEKGLTCRSCYSRKVIKDCTCRYEFWSPWDPMPHHKLRGVLQFSSEPSGLSIPRKGFLDSFYCMHLSPLCMVQAIRSLGSCFKTNHGRHFI